MARRQSDLPRALCLGDPLRIRQRLATKRPIPIGIRGDLVRLLRDRGDAALALADRLDADN